MSTVRSLLLVPSAILTLKHEQEALYYQHRVVKLAGSFQLLLWKGEESLNKYSSCFTAKLCS